MRDRHCAKILRDKIKKTYAFLKNSHIYLGEKKYANKYWKIDTSAVYVKKEGNYIIKYVFVVTLSTREQRK